MAFMIGDEAGDELNEMLIDATDDGTFAWAANRYAGQLSRAIAETREFIATLEMLAARGHVRALESGDLYGKQKKLQEMERLLVEVEEMYLDPNLKDELRAEGDES